MHRRYTTIYGGEEQSTYLTCVGGRGLCSAISPLVRARHVQAMPRFFGGLLGARSSPPESVEGALDEHPSSSYSTYGVTGWINQSTAERARRLHTLRSIFVREIERDREQRRRCLALVRSCVAERRRITRYVQGLAQSAPNLEDSAEEVVALSSACGLALNSDTGCALAYEASDLGCDHSLASRARAAALEAAMWARALITAHEALAFRALCNARAHDRRNPLLPGSEGVILPLPNEECAAIRHAHERASQISVQVQGDRHNATGDGPDMSVVATIRTILTKLSFAAEVTETIKGLHHSLPAPAQPASLSAPSPEAASAEDGSGTAGEHLAANERPATIPGAQRAASSASDHQHSSAVEPAPMVSHVRLRPFDGPPMVDSSQQSKATSKLAMEAITEASHVHGLGHQAAAALPLTVACGKRGSIAEEERATKRRGGRAADDSAERDGNEDMSNDEDESRRLGVLEGAVNRAGGQHGHPVGEEAEDDRMEDDDVLSMAEAVEDRQTGEDGVKEHAAVRDEIFLEDAIEGVEEAEPLGEQRASDMECGRDGGDRHVAPMQSRADPQTVTAVPSMHESRIDGWIHEYLTYRTTSMAARQPPVPVQAPLPAPRATAPSVASVALISRAEALDALRVASTTLRQTLSPIAGSGGKTAAASSIGSSRGSRRRQRMPIQTIDIFATEPSSPAAAELCAPTLELLEAARCAISHEEAASWEVLADCARLACMHALEAGTGASWESYTTSMNVLLPAASLHGRGVPRALLVAREELRQYMYRASEGEMGSSGPPPPTSTRLAGLSAAALNATLAVLDSRWAAAATKARGDAQGGAADAQAAAPSSAERDTGEASAAVSEGRNGSRPESHPVRPLSLPFLLHTAERLCGASGHGLTNQVKSSQPTPGSRVMSGASAAVESTRVQGPGSRAAAVGSTRVHSKRAVVQEADAAVEPCVEGTGYRPSVEVTWRQRAVEPSVEETWKVKDGIWSRQP